MMIHKWILPLTQGRGAFARALAGITGACLFASATPAISADVTDYKVRYALDEGTGNQAADSAGNVGDATLQNGAAWSLDTSDDRGFALQFDGSDDRLDIPDDADINDYNGTRDEYTLSLWFKADDVSPAGHQLLFEEGGTVNGLNLYLVNGTLYAGAWSESTNWNGAWASSTAVSSGAWHHVVLTLDAPAGELKLYLDGDLQETLTGEAVSGHGGDNALARINGNTKLHDLGDYSGDAPYAGLIDDFRVYHYPLTAEQVSDVEAAGRPMMSHMDVPEKMAEHQALHMLFPRVEATHVGVADGNWSDPATWQGGQVPGTDAKVLIADGRTVTYDADDSSTRLFGVRVDGKLQWATDTDTHMIVDTLISTTGSELEIGTESNPVEDTVEARITIAPVDPAAPGAYDIDTTWDWQQLSRGVVTHGKTRIHGAEKTTWAQLDQDALAGSNSIHLSSAVTGWKVGDRLVLTGTERDEDYASDGTDNFTTQDEELTVASVSGDGRTITFNETLQYDHTGRGTDLLDRPIMPYVGNFSRNIVFETENPSGLAANQRGHVMFMHNPDVDVRYAEFFELGRTDKSRPLDDFELTSGNYDDRSNSGRVTDGNGDYIDGPRTNIRGRYSFHFHRTGVAAQVLAVAEGNSVWGSPGWGFVHHDSHASFVNNVSYNVLGAHFVAEVGNESGEWNYNLAIKSIGDPDVPGGKVKTGTFNHDTGWVGTGFWFHSRMIENEGNVAASNRHTGFFWFNRGVDTIGPVYEQVEQTGILTRRGNFSEEDHHIKLFKDNVALNAGSGFYVIKNNADQGHDIHTVFEGFTGWEVGQISHVEYTSKYVYHDVTGVSSKVQTGLRKAGFAFFSTTSSQTFNNVLLVDFGSILKWDNGDAQGIDSDDYDVNFIDIDFQNSQVSYTDLSELVFLSDDAPALAASSLHFHDSADIVDGRLLFAIDNAATNYDYLNGNVEFRGTKTDSINSTDPQAQHSQWFWREGNVKGIAERQGYWTRASDGLPFAIVTDYAGDRATGTWGVLEFGAPLDEIPTDAVNNGVWDPATQVLVNEDWMLGNYEPDARFVFEAEDGTLGSEWEVLTDSSYSGGEAIWTTSGQSGSTPTDTSAAAKASYNFTVDSSDDGKNFRFWFRLQSDGPNINAFFWRIDNGAWVLEDGRDGIGDWHFTDDANVDSLAAGSHTLEIVYRDSRTKIDKLVIQLDEHEAPRGDGPAVPGAQPASASADSGLAVNEGSSNNTLDVLANDSGTGIEITSVTSPSYGTVSNNGGDLEYTPFAGVWGQSDTFDYTITADDSTTDTASVTVAINATDGSTEIPTADFPVVMDTTGYSANRVLDGSGNWQLVSDGTGFDTSGSNDNTYMLADNTVTGDFDSWVQLVSLSGPSGSRMGLMLRDGDTAGAEFIAIGSADADGYKFQERTDDTAGADAEVDATAGSTHTFSNGKWVLLQRIGNTVTVAVDDDNDGYTEETTVDINGWSDTLHVGLFVHSGSAGSNAVGEFDNYNLVPISAGGGTISEVAGSFTTGLTSASIPSGDDRLLVFVAQSEFAGTLDSVTYGGQSMSKAIDYAQGANEVSIWYLNDAGIAAATGTTFTPSWSGGEAGEGYSSFFLTGVDQTAPQGETATAGDPYNTADVDVSTAALAVNEGDYSVFGVVRGSSSAAFSFSGGYTEKLHYSITSGDAAVATQAISADGSVTPTVSHGNSGYRIALAACVFKAGAGNPGPAPLLHWEFDENANSTAGDSSGNGYDGVITGASWSTDTPDGSTSSLSFDGSGDVVEDADAENYLNGLDAFTATAWIKAGSTGSNRGVFITESPSGSDGVVGLRHDSSGGSGNGSNVFKGGVATTGGDSVLESSDSSQSTDWQHVAITWSSGGAVTFYINGVEDTPTAAPTSETGTLTDVTTLMVGRGSKDGSTGSWNGLIDDFRIYDAELTAGEISDIYNGN